MKKPHGNARRVRRFYNNMFGAQLYRRLRASDAPSAPYVNEDGSCLTYEQWLKHNEDERTNEDGG